MPVNQQAFAALCSELKDKNVSMVAVSKTKPPEEILALYELGQRDFGENYVQELVEKQARLPSDIRWHFIGHLQSNKVKFISPFVHLVHGVDSEKLLKEIDKQAAKINRTINVLLQVHIAEEESKFGFDEAELRKFMSGILQENKSFEHAPICGLMGMASFSDDAQKVRHEFRRLKSIFDQYHSPQFTILSMGMSGDYQIAIEEGSNMVRIGSLLFGQR